MDDNENREIETYKEELKQKDKELKLYKSSWDNRYIKPPLMVGATAIPVGIIMLFLSTKTKELLIGGIASIIIGFIFTIIGLGNIFYKKKTLKDNDEQNKYRNADVDNSRQKDDDI